MHVRSFIAIYQLYLSDEIKRIQRRALRIIFPGCNYNEGLAKAGLPTLYDRKRTLCKDLLKKNCAW